jgi:repressor LexA
MISNKASKNIDNAPSQQAVLIWIFEASPDGARSPTLQELTVGVKSNAKSNISRILDELEDKGYVEGERAESSSARSRGFWLTKKALRWLRSEGRDTSNYIRAYIASHDIRVAPLLGEIAAGNPISPDATIPDEDVEEYVPLPARNLSIGPVYMLRVKGDSMIGDHILNDDQVIVVPYSGRPKGNGEIVVAVVDRDVTVKHLKILDGKFHLEPSNPDHQVRIEEPENVRIQGRVIGLLRVSG